MDDIQEAKTLDTYNCSKYVFISSWMDQSKESIAMWKLYSNYFNGVRIGMKENPFKKYSVTKKEFKEYLPKNIGISGEHADLVVPLKEYINDRYIILNAKYDQVLESVEDIDDEDCLIPNIVTDDKVNINIFSLN